MFESQRYHIHCRNLHDSAFWPLEWNKIKWSGPIPKTLEASAPSASPYPRHSHNISAGDGGDGGNDIDTACNNVRFVGRDDRINIECSYGNMSERLTMTSWKGKSPQRNSSTVNLVNPNPSYPSFASWSLTSGASSSLYHNKNKCIVLVFIVIAIWMYYEMCTMTSVFVDILKQYYRFGITTKLVDAVFCHIIKKLWILHFALWHH